MKNTLSTSLITAVVVALSVAAPAAARAQTFGSASPDNAIAPFGRDALSSGVIGTVAESFTTPGGSPILQSFTFFLSDNFDGIDLLVDASIFKFSGDHLTGSAVLPGIVRSGSSNIVGYDAVTFSGLNVLLAPGTVYAVVLRTAAASPDGSTNFVGSTFGDSFTLGQLFTSLDTSDADLGALGAFTASDASTFGVDAALQMTFAPIPVSATPEPASIALVATGILGLVIARRRRADG